MIVLSVSQVCEAGLGTGHRQSYWSEYIHNIVLNDNHQHITPKMPYVLVRESFLDGCCCIEGLPLNESKILSKK